jgi:hypothetical protein
MKAIDDLLQFRPWQRIDAENAFVGAIMLAKHRELHAEPGAAAHHAMDYRRLIHHVKDPETAHALAKALRFARKPVASRPRVFPDLS